MAANNQKKGAGSGTGTKAKQKSTPKKTTKVEPAAADRLSIGEVWQAFCERLLNPYLAKGRTMNAHTLEEFYIDRAGWVRQQTATMATNNSSTRTPEIPAETAEQSKAATA